MKKKLTCMLLIFAVLFSGCASASEGEMPGVPAALEQETVSETISAEEEPASETISAEEGPAPETISAEEGPASETISAEEKPASETISAEEKPASETISAEGEPASETISAEEEPASETISAEEEPASETISAEEEPASETISAEEEPASEASAAETPVSDPAADANPTAVPEPAPAADFLTGTDIEPGGEISGTSAGGEQGPAEEGVVPASEENLRGAPETSAAGGTFSVSADETLSKEQEITESAADDSCFENDAAEADSESGEDRFEDDAAEADSESGEDRFEDDAAEADSESEENGFEDADPAGCGEMQEGQSAGDASAQGEADGKGLPAAAASSGQGTPLGVIREKLDTDTPMTAILAGISAENKEKIVKEINDYIEQFVQNNLGLKIEDPILPDAEKYYVNGYDKSLCWAAVAANMLWTSNLAQVSTNPATGVPFQNVDEVFDYFRGIFTDLSGRPDGALAVFLKGASAYPFTSSRLSQLKSKDVKALVPADITIPDYGTVNIKGDINEISRLEKLAVQSLGVLLHSYDTFEEKMGKLAHWVTSPGIIIDETASGTDRYKAIVIADSDNDKVGGDGSIPDAEKAAKAAKATNSYTIYPLKLKTYDTIGQRWTIPFYTNETLSKFDVVIDWISYLGVIPPQKKEAEESVGPEDDDDEWDDDGWDEDDWDYEWEYDESEEDDDPVVPSDPVQPAKPDQPAKPEPADSRDGQDNRDGDDWQYDETPAVPDDSDQPVIPEDTENEDSSDDWFDDSLTDFNWDDMDWKEYEEFMDRLIKIVRQADHQTDDDGFFTDVKNWMAEKNLDVYSITDWNYSLAKDKTFLVFVRTDPSQLLNVLLDGRLLTSYLKNYEVIDKNTGTFLIVISSDVMQKLKAGDHRLTLEINGIGEVDRTIRVGK